MGEQSRKLKVHQKDINKFGKVPSLMIVQKTLPVAHFWGSPKGKWCTVDRFFTWPSKGLPWEGPIAYLMFLFPIAGGFAVAHLLLADCHVNHVRIKCGSFGSSRLSSCPFDVPSMSAGGRYFATAISLDHDKAPLGISITEHHQMRRHICWNICCHTWWRCSPWLRGERWPKDDGKEKQKNLQTWWKNSCYSAAR